jgi:hypothetical protein
MWNMIDFIFFLLKTGHGLNLCLQQEITVSGKHSCFPFCCSDFEYRQKNFVLIEVYRSLTNCLQRV